MAKCANSEFARLGNDRVPIVIDPINLPQE